jgi:adenylate cyclase
LGEPQARILSIVEEVALFRESEVFFLTDFRGRLLFNKAGPAHAGDLLSGIPDVLAALQGNEIFTWWGSADAALAAARLLPRGGPPRLYQMFLKPVAFQGEVKGLIAIGFAVGAVELAEILGITRAEIAFIANDTLYLNSLAGMPAETLLALPRAPGAVESSRMLRFPAGEQEFLALPVPMVSSLGSSVGAVLVYRSKTLEKAIFNRLRQTLNAIGVAALALAAALAYLISHNVSGALRQLFAGVREVRGGNLEVRLAIRSRDEFGALGEDFNEMAKGLKEKETIRDTFKRYVSSSVVDELLRNVDDLKLGGETKELTIQFSDIASFTSLSETLSPEEVIAFLNEYLSAMTAEVEAEGGIVDKYIGDAVMAFWGAPVPQPDHPLRACRAALAQFASLERLRSGWAGRGALERFAIRLGLHCGEVVVGNIGSNTRMDYTIIGDAVNTASRLEGMNKVYGTGILISEHVQRRIGEGFVTRELDLIRPVGRAAPVRIFELVCRREAAPSALADRHARFGEGLAHYRARRFGEALASFEAVQAGRADPPARVFATRCRDYLAEPPPPDWDAVYVPASK